MAPKAEKRERARKFDKTPWGFIMLMLLAIAATIAAICLGINYNIIAICIIGLVALIAIMVVVARVETCPYCGSIRLKKEKIDPRFNIANWSVKCKKCGEEFFME